MAYCHYYQAHTPASTACIFVGILRNHEHLVFDRTLDLSTSTFEFFVPADQEQEFIALMNILANRKLVSNIQKLPNRIQNNTQDSLAPTQKLTLK